MKKTLHKIAKILYLTSIVSVFFTQSVISIGLAVIFFFVAYFTAEGSVSNGNGDSSYPHHQYGSNTYTEDYITDPTYKNLPCNILYDNKY